MCLCVLFQAASLEIVWCDSLLSTKHAHCVFRATAAVESPGKTLGSTGVVILCFDFELILGHHVFTLAKFFADPICIVT